MEEEKLSKLRSTSDRFGGGKGKAVRTTENLRSCWQNLIISTQTRVSIGGKIHLKILFIPTLSGGY
ncbi:hypothetical protein [Mesobacillus sp.]|uniref:hypothetical protein n=1 Tax=Mesobacillus sp. TaxID=2675271 RepID=UPI0039F116CE